MNINLKYMKEFTGNQSILDKKEKGHFKSKNSKGETVFSYLMHKLVSLPEIINTFKCTNGSVS